MDITRHEFNLLIALLIPTVLLGILPNVVLQSIFSLLLSLTIKILVIIYFLSLKILTNMNYLFLIYNTYSIDRIYPFCTYKNAIKEKVF